MFQHNICINKYKPFLNKKVYITDPNTFIMLTNKAICSSIGLLLNTCISINVNQSPYNLNYYDIVNMQRLLLAVHCKGEKETLTQIREEGDSWGKVKKKTRIRRKRWRRKSFMVDRSGEASLLTVVSAALLQLLLRPAQRLLLLAEVCTEALPRRCKTGICWGRGCVVVGRQGAPRSEPQGRRMKMNGSVRLGMDSPGYDGGVVSQEVQKWEV